LRFLPASISVNSVYEQLRSLHFLDRVYAPPSVVLASLAAACCYAIAAAAQQSAAREEAPDLALRPALLLALARRPRWLLGIVASIAGFVFQFLALRRGALALVEPLLVTSLVIVLPLAALIDHRRVSRREWLSGLLIIAALAVFLLAARPGLGAPRADAGAWIALGAVTLALVAACVRFAGPSGPRRALALGAGAGLLFGVTGAITQTTGHLLDHGIVHTLESWPPYALIAASGLGVLLNQSAFQAGELEWSLPVMTILEPLVAIVIGQYMFDEHIAGSALARLGEVAGLGGMTVGVLMLAGWRAVPTIGAPGRAQPAGE
jgi:drug/metabolite transporter (DMT)-like permease